MIVGKHNARVIVRADTEEEADRRSYPNNRRRIHLIDEDGETVALQLDATERQALRKALDEIGPDDAWKY